MLFLCVRNHSAGKEVIMGERKGGMENEEEERKEWVRGRSGMEEGRYGMKEE